MLNVFEMEWTSPEQIISLGNNIKTSINNSVTINIEKNTTIKVFNSATILNSIAIIEDTVRYLNDKHIYLEL
jgi:hypothetical protein